MNLCAIIVETRPIPHLVNIIRSHFKFLPEHTDLAIFYGDKTAYLIKKLKPIISIKIKDDFHRVSYNLLLTSPTFWGNFLLWDKVLIFQSDSMILREGIEEFYKYDYIGASWKWTDEYAGNGGLSLRNPSVMFDICRNFHNIQELNEDHFIVKTMHENKIGNLAPIEVADKFSCEAKFILGTWGYHAIDAWLSKEECKQIRNQYKGGNDHI